MEENFDGLRVRNFSEGTFDEFLKVFNVSWFSFFEELKIVLVVLEKEFDTELNISFGTFHDIEDISEGKLRLDHPELGDVSAGM